MKNKGFTLVELVISMFILCFVLLALAAFMGTLYKITNQDRIDTVGISLVQDKMEFLKNAGFSNIVTGKDTGTQTGFNYTRTWTVTSNGNMKQVDITVTIGNRITTASTIISQ